MLSACTVNYLVYSEEEIQQWKDDSLDFYLGMKESSNVTKGNYLREKTTSLLAAIELRFTKIFQSFCAETHAQLLSIKDQNTIKSQVEKDALMQVIKMRLSDE